MINYALVFVVVVIIIITN